MEQKEDPGGLWRARAGWGGRSLSKHKLPFLAGPGQAAGDITWAAFLKSLELGSPTRAAGSPLARACSPTPAGLINKLGPFQLRCAALAGPGSAGGGQTVLL